MNRLERKCFVTAAAAHGLLFVILIVGPAFLMHSAKNDSFREITVYSPSSIDRALTQGGTPQNVAAAAVPVSAPESHPLRAPPPVELAKPPKVEPAPDMEKPKPDVKLRLREKGDDPPTPKTKRLPTISDAEMTPSPPKRDNREAKRKAEQEERARADAVAAAQRERELGQLRDAVRSISKQISGETLVKMPVGVGGGGAAQVAYRDIIASKYYNAWQPSFALSDNIPDATVSITVQRDGSVTGRIIKKSGSRDMDKSVQAALDAVSFIAPFPPSFTEQQMTVPLIFNLQAKRP